MAEKKEKKNERVQNHIASPTGIANKGDHLFSRLKRESGSSESDLKK